MSGAMLRVGHLAARFAWWVLAAWVALAVTASAVVGVIGAPTDNDLSLPGTDSQAATDVLASRFPPQQNGTSPLVFHVDDGRLTDDATKSAVHAAVAALRDAPHVYSVVNPVSTAGQSAGLLSSDGSTGYAPVLLDIDSGKVDEELADEIITAARGPAAAAGIEVEAGGSIGARLSEPKTESSEVVGLAAAMVILTLVLGSLVAMGLPILVAVLALSTALSVIGLMGHVYGVPSIGPTVATMIGLGVGIDYALFLVTRHQDQLRKGVPVTDSVAQAVATSGSAIVFAGSTVVIALLCLVLADIPLVTAIGLAAAVAVVLAVLGATTLLPALLALIGHRIRWLALPGWLQRRPTSGGGVWGRWSRTVTGHPWVAMGVSLLVLAPLIVPVFSLELGQEDISVTPTSTTERRAYDLVSASLGVGYNGPLQVASVLDPVATPSAKYQRQYDEATSLKRELKQEQRSLTQQQQQLEAQQAELEREQADLESDADALEAQEAELLREQGRLEAEGAALEQQEDQLERQRAQLQSEAERLRRQAERLARQAERTAAALLVVRAREQLIEDRIARADEPRRIERLERRLARVQEREQRLVDRTRELKAEARVLVREGRALEAQAISLQREAQALQAEAAVLQQEGAELAAQGARLQRQAATLAERRDALTAAATSLQDQADSLRAQKRQAEQQKKRAEKLKRILTRELTAAGGDDRATDPRVVSLQQTLLATPGVVALTPPQVSDSGDALLVNAIPASAPASDTTAALVATLRDEVLPSVSDDGQLTSHVGGYTASNVDLAAKIADRLPVVVLTVLMLSFVLLLVAFRSLLVPLQAGLMNLLSVGASFGVLTLVFQWGWGLSLVGLDAPSGTVPIASYVPLMMFAILFGLSMDYEVFLVSHIIAGRDGGLSARPAVAAGLAASGRVIGAAALIMVCVFGSFILNGDPTVKQFGVGLSVAVTLAAGLVLVLAPALLWLFGEATWRLPRWLASVVPDIGLKEGTTPSEGE